MLTLILKKCCARVVVGTCVLVSKPQVLSKESPANTVARFAWSIRGQLSVRASDELLVNRAVGHVHRPSPSKANRAVANSRFKRQSFMAGQPPPRFVAKACESLSAEGVMPSVRPGHLQSRGVKVR